LFFVLVSWKWSGSRPSGEVAEVKEQGDVSIESNRGNTIKRTGKGPEDPAVHIAHEGNDVVKLAHELAVEEKANGTKEDQQKDANDVEEEKEGKTAVDTNGEAKAGEKHARGETSVANDDAKANDDKESKDVDMKDVTQSGKPAVGEDDGEAEKDEEPALKKQKMAKDDEGDKDEGEKKARGRPKKSASQSSQTPAKKKEPKPASTEDGKPRRSARFQS
jgi:DUF2945 family protein